MARSDELTDQGQWLYELATAIDDGSVLTWTRDVRMEIAGHLWNVAEDVSEDQYRLRGLEK